MRRNCVCDGGCSSTPAYVLPLGSYINYESHKSADYTQFYVEYYTSGVTASMTEEKEELLKKRWPAPTENGTVAVLTGNSTVVDKGGKILAWILPGVLSLERQVSECGSRPIIPS